MQKAKGKTEDAQRNRRRREGESSPFSACTAHESNSWTFTFLPFTFCLFIFAFALCLLPTDLRAQGCAMCYTSASAARAGAKEALANGVLILLIPPMVFFALITVIIYKYRNKFRDSAIWRPEDDRELQEVLAEIAPAGGAATDRAVEPIGDRVI